MGLLLLCNTSGTPRNDSGTVPRLLINPFSTSCKYLVLFIKYGFDNFNINDVSPVPSSIDSFGIESLISI